MAWPSEKLDSVSVNTLFHQIVNILIIIEDILYGDNHPINISLEGFLTTTPIVKDETSIECTLNTAALSICIHEINTTIVIQNCPGQGSAERSCNEENELF